MSRTSDAVRTAARMVACCAMLFIAATSVTEAEEAPVDPFAPYRGYVYNAWREAIPSYNGYLPVKAVRGRDWGVGDMSSPQDMFLAPNGELYVLDAGNARIIVLSKELRLRRVIDTFRKDAEEFDLSDARGLFVRADGTIYIADKGAGRIVVCDRNGSVRRVIEQPVSAVVPEGFIFQPEKLVVDRAGRLYIKSFGVFEGLIMYTAEGDFAGFFGSNRVVLSLRIVRELFWKRLLSREQTEAMIRIIPEEYSNLDIDSEGFIYTSTVGRENSRNEIKKLNPLGVNILRARRDPAFPTDDFGDLEVTRLAERTIDSQFVDVDVDEASFINGLDANRGRVFQYDQESNLLFAFGGLGDQVGLFKQPVAVESYDNTILVLDTRNGDITVFAPSPFGREVRSAIRLYNDGRYDQAVAPWTEVLATNTNYRLASIGIGKARLMSEAYGDALRFFRLGYDRGSYSQAFRYYRTEYLRDHFGAFATVSVSALALSWAFFVRKSLWPRLTGRPWPARTPRGFAEQLSLMLSVIIHPLDSFNEIKQRDRGSVPLALGIIILWFFATTFRRQFTGFIFNYNNPEELNVPIILTTTVVLFGLWAVANWCVSSMLDGEGTMREIVIYSAYALQPFVVAVSAATVASNFATLEERLFVDIVRYLGAGWSIVLVLAGHKTLHQYSFSTTVLSITLTVAGIGVIIFLFTLVFTMFQELGGFVTGIISEIRYRL